MTFALEHNTLFEYPLDRVKILVYCIPGYLEECIDADSFRFLSYDDERTWREAARGISWKVPSIVIDIYLRIGLTGPNAFIPLSLTMSKIG